MNVCVYHGVDLDGYCSAAIWKAEHPEGELIGLNYGQEIPWDRLEGNEVTLVDFCFQPWPEMDRLIECASNVTWIDHHKSAIESWKQAGCEFIQGSRDVEHAACELTWWFYHRGEPLPHGVFLLGDYDCWRHSHDDTMAYQWGMRLDNWDPGDNPACMDDWKRVFADDEGLMDGTLSSGQTILQYQGQQNAKSAKAIWFPVEFAGFRWMAVNQGGINSQFWDAVWDDSFDGKLSFVRSRNHWTVSLYSETVDCSLIAKDNGGGGHKGAAGFQCASLPFRFTEAA
jgi:oligoribonuclease NrnB/cAMP/cGMP phosphodiesterase (DHH superfamily)